MAGKILTVLLAACLLLTACGSPTPPSAEPPSPPAEKPAPDQTAEEPHPILLDHLTVEVVVGWEDTDRMLGCLDDLSRLLENALMALECTVEEPVTVTIGTAGGITAQALEDGGVDAAFLPRADLASLEEGGAVEVLADEGGTFVMAVTGERRDQHICSILPQALTATEAGREFLEICYPEAAFAPASQAVQRAAK